jgi:hypothetical protein
VVILSFLEGGGVQRWRHCVSSWRRIEAFLSELGSGACDFDGWCSKSEGLGLSDFARIGVLHFVALAVLGGRKRVDVHGVAGWWSPAAGARRHGAESGSVRCGLGAELGEVQVRAGLIAGGHGLPELPLGPESVEDDAVDGDAQYFDDDLDDAADK